MDTAKAASGAAMALVLASHTEAEAAVAAAHALAQSIASGGGAAGVALACPPHDSGTPPTIRWRDGDANGRISGGDAVIVSGGTCGGQAAANTELSVTGYAEDELGVAELRGQLTFSRSLAPAGGPAASTDGSLRVEYAAPEGRTDVRLSEIEVTNESAEVALRLIDGTHRLTFDHAAQTRAVSLAGRVRDLNTGDEFQFETPVAFEHDWRAHPALGELVVTSGESRSRLTTLAQTLRRASVALAVDGDADGRYEAQAEMRWDDLLGGEAERVFSELFGFAGVIRGFFVSPFGPRTGQQLHARVGIPQDDQPQSGTVHYEWTRNGERLAVPFPDYYLGASETAKGDRIEARLVFSADPDATRTAYATIRNSPPYVRVQLSPEAPDTSDDIVASLEELDDADHDPVTVTHEWRVNDAVVDGVAGDTLAAALHDRGDRVTYTALADDGEDVAVHSWTTTIGNAPPRVTGEAPATVAQGGEASFEVSIDDPDGDPVAPGTLRVDYGPPGMAIDADGRVTIAATMPLFDRTQAVHWQIGATAASTQPLRGTTTVVDEDGGYPWFRTRLQPPGKLQVADLDGDGDGELLVLGGAGPHVLEWDGEAYAQSWAYPYALGSGGPASVTHADIDQDGRDEIFVAVGGQSPRVVRLDGNERRVAALGVPEIDGQPAGCRDLEAGDLDGDGLWELVCLTGSHHVVVLSALDLETLWVAGPAQPAVGDAVFRTGVAVGNVDADPSLEIVTSTGYVYDGASRGLDWQYERTFSARTVALGDVDGDGVQEIIGNGLYRAGNGPAAFPVRSEWQHERAKGTVADTNGDGRPELVYWDNGDALVVRVYQYDDLDSAPAPLYEVPLLPEVSSGFTEPVPTSAELQVAHLAAGDLDGDGRDELVFAGPTYYAVASFDGAVAFEWSADDVSGAEFRGGALVPGVPASLLFIARSGYPPHASDRWWCPACGQAVMRFPIPRRGASAPARTTVQPVGGGAMTATGSVTDLVATDVDGDGAVELTAALLGPRAVEGRSDSGTSLHAFDARLNQWMAIPGLGQLENNGRSRQLHAPWRLALGDVNGDGRADLLAGGGFEAHSREPHVLAFDLLERSALFETDEVRELHDTEDTVSAIAGADLDGDGRAEIIVGAERDFHRADRLFVYAPSGVAGDFARTDHAVNLEKIHDIVVGDFDGAGGPEVVLFGGAIGEVPDTVVRLDAAFEELNRFLVSAHPQATRRLLVPDGDRGPVGRRTVLFVESMDHWAYRDATVVSGIDVLTGNRVWSAPELLGALRDIALVDDGERVRWVVATSTGMYLTR